MASGRQRGAGLPDAAGYTDVTEATLFLALFGPRTFEVTEHLTNLDLGIRSAAPFLLQGPLAHVPCQAVVLARGEGRRRRGAAHLFRGYARDMVRAILSAGRGPWPQACGRKSVQDLGWRPGEVSGGPYDRQ